MQRICASKAMRRSEQAYLLLTRQAKSSVETDPRRSKGRIIPVDTLTYSGVWLEGEITQGTIDEAHQLLRAGAAGAQMGAVVPDGRPGDSRPVAG